MENISEEAADYLHESKINCYSISLSNDDKNVYFTINLLNEVAEKIFSYLVLDKEIDKIVLSNSIVQKWNYDGNGDPKPMPIYRETLQPLKKIEFSISAISEEAISLIDSLENIAEKHYLFYKAFFLDKGFDEKYIQGNMEAPIYLGAGSGIWTKTNIRQIDHDHDKI